MTMKLPDIKLAPDEILVLRTCGEGGKSYGGFVWPTSGDVEAPDWQYTDDCGHGLHGLPWGVGGTGYLTWNSKANNGWVAIVSTAAGGYQHGTGGMRGKCKFRRAKVVLSNATREECVALIMQHAPQLSAVNWATQTAGNASTQTAGYESTQTAGDASTQKAGDASTQTAGDESTQTAGYESTQKAGEASTQKAGKNSAQIVTYYDSGWKTKARVVLDAEADKWWKFENGDWRLCSDAEAEAAEKRVNKIK